MPYTVKEENYLYKDYIRWLNDDLYGIIDRQAYNMTYAPGRKYLKISQNFFSQLKNRRKELFYSFELKSYILISEKLKIEKRYTLRKGRFGNSKKFKLNETSRSNLLHQFTSVKELCNRYYIYYGGIE